MMSRCCPLCWRLNEEGSEYCRYHSDARQSLHKAFSLWRDALEIGWEDYLVAVSARQESGKWVCEVAHHLLEKGKNGA